MQSSNKLLHVLRSSPTAVTFGAWQMLPGANHARTIARCGYDWVCVDEEHGNIDDGAMHDAVAAIAACGVSPVVRIPANEGWMVKRALDSGAHGIVVPLLNTAEDGRKLVRTAKFPPLGQRGFGSPFTHERFGLEDSTAYLQQANEGLVTIVQIETQEALDNVEEIAQVQGIDVLLIGPFDLGNSIGCPIIDGKMHENLKNAIEKILKATKDHGKHAGMFCTSGEQAREFADKGFNMISVTGDMIVIPAAFTSTLTAAKGGYAHAALNVAKGAASRFTGH